MTTESLEALVYSNPLALLSLTGEDLHKANEYLPYSTGIELECPRSRHYSHSHFEKIVNIMATDGCASEQRYRIPNGLAGLITLFFISKELKLNCELNPDSGNHYHVDCTELQSGQISSMISANQNWACKELDTWRYKGTYNKRSYSWIRYNGHGTTEIRIGEMTFEYPLLAKRVIHCNKIVRTLKEKYIPDIKPPVYKPLDIPKIIAYATESLKRTSPITEVDYLKQKLERFAKSVVTEVREEVDESLDEMRAFIRNRNT